MVKLFGAEKSADAGSNRTLSETRQATLKSYVSATEFKGRPSFATFNDCYDNEEIKNDLEKAKELRTKFTTQETKQPPEAQEANLYAKALEVAILELGNEWLPGVTVSRSSFYDDYARGLDLFLEFKDEAGVVQRVGIDVTSSEREAVSKLLDIYTQLKQGLFAAAKYFRSKLDDTKGTAVMQRLIIGADRTTMITFFKLYSEYLQKISTDTGIALKKQMGEHGIKNEIILQLQIEIERCLDIMTDISETHGTETVRHALQTLKEKLSHEKNKVSSQAASLAGDRVSNAVLETSTAAL